MTGAGAAAAAVAVDTVPVLARRVLVVVPLCPEPPHPCDNDEREIDVPATGAMPAVGRANGMTLLVGRCLGVDRVDGICALTPGSRGEADGGRATGDCASGFEITGRVGESSMSRLRACRCDGGAPAPRCAVLGEIFGARGVRGEREGGAPGGLKLSEGGME